MIYFVQDSVKNGDIFEEGPFKTVEEARSAANNALWHLTEREKKTCMLYIEGWDAPEDKDFDEWFNEENGRDPDYYELFFKGERYE